MTKEEALEEIKDLPWTSYDGRPWTGTDPETHGDDLLTIYKPYGYGSSFRYEHPHFIFNELSDYVVELHNLVRDNGGLEAVKEKLGSSDEVWSEVVIEEFATREEAETAMDEDDE